MLFNSLPFLLFYLPVTFAGFFLLGRKSARLSALWLALASLFFYGWWNASFVSLLLGSILFNYGAGWLIGHGLTKPGRHYRKTSLGVAVTANLLLLGWYKYAGFFAGVIESLSGTPLVFVAPLLPLGISFFTFTQIAFLVDTYQGKAREYNFIHYLLFVTYFPHLIAGPILHHKQMMPQFEEARTYRFDWSNIAIGLTIFTIGLAKKVLVADQLSPIATPIFSAAGSGADLALAEAWAGALAYTLQLYFDFSGYSDMAIGLSRLFNVRLPLNFNSPYKATSIIDFWRRWHMTLSAFLRDYLYIPLGGNRHGPSRRHLNLFLTMLLGGLWHGAGWTFIFWGALHGIFLIINHGFRALCAALGLQPQGKGLTRVIASGALTFICVTIGWVFFRAENFQTALAMLKSMFGMHGVAGHKLFAVSGVADSGLTIIVLGLAAVWLLPNTQEWMRGYDPAYEKIPEPSPRTPKSIWNPDRWWAWAPLGVLFALAFLGLTPARVSEFLYFQF